jgi:hypothetical protein
VINKDLGDRCRQLLESSLKKLERDKGKDFHDLEIHFHVQTLEESLLQNPCMTDSWPAIGMVDWMWHVVCLVPIQISREENNTPLPLVEGLHISSDLNYWDTVSLANLLQFGLYEPVLGS